MFTFKVYGGQGISNKLNHFIELQMGSDGFVWIMIHSGSRYLGHEIASFYIQKAMQLCTKWHSRIPSFKGDDNLAFLPLGDKLGQDYMGEMNFASSYALANRYLMMERCKSEIRNVIPNVKFGKEINVHHNFAEMEHHFGKNVLVHRKGATRAREGDEGIIPGSQGTKSYIVEGLGNELSFHSCSHGAGRVLSRRAAKKELNLEEQIKILDEQGIVHGMRTNSDLEEAVDAYRDIEEVMSNQDDLVRVKVQLTPIGGIKA